MATPVRKPPDSTIIAEPSAVDISTSASAYRTEPPAKVRAAP